MTDTPTNPRWMTWTGRVLGSVLVALFCLDGAIKLVPLQPVVETSALLGLPTDVVSLRGLGLVLLASTLLFAVPRTAVLGAILLTAYLGGAVATHMRVGSPLFTHLLFGVYLGVFVWLSLWLRDPRLRALLALRWRRTLSGLTPPPSR